MRFPNYWKYGEPRVAMDHLGNIYGTFNVFGRYPVGPQWPEPNFVESNRINVFKLEPIQGRCMWSVEDDEYNQGERSYNPDIAVDSLGYIYVVYYTTFPYPHIGLFKLNFANGHCMTIVSDPFSTGPENIDDLYPAIVIDQSDHLYLTYQRQGSFSGWSAAGDIDIIVGQLDITTYQPIWITQNPVFNTNLDDIRPRIATDQMGHIYLTYSTWGITSGNTPTGGADIVVLKLDDSDGRLLWIIQKPTFNTQMNDLRPYLTTDLDGDVYVVYDTDYGIISGRTDMGDSSTVVFKLGRNDGSLIWTTVQPSFWTGGTGRNKDIKCGSTGFIYVAYNEMANFVTSTPGIGIFQIEPNSGVILWHWALEPTPPMDYISPSMVIDQSENLYVIFHFQFNPKSLINSKSLIKDEPLIKASRGIAVMKLYQQDALLSIVTYYGIVNSSGPNIVPGDTILYTYGIQNIGTVILSNVIVRDNLGNFVYIGSLSPDQLYTSQRTYTLTYVDIDNGVVETHVDATGEFYRMIVTSHRDTIVPIQQTSSFHLTKLALSVGDHVGDLVQYQINLINDGNILIDHIILSDSMLNLHMNLPPMLPTEHFSLLRDYIITQQDMDRKIITNQVQVTGVDWNQQPVMKQTQISVIPCVVGETMILMSDGSTKPISQIQRGDVVASHHRVSRLCQIPLVSQAQVALIVFAVDSLGHQQPNIVLKITENHPIRFNNIRQPAKMFVNSVNITRIKETEIKCLYDLQFDYDTYYVANGVQIQSCSPHSILNPLPQHLYHDPSLYTGELVWDQYNLTN